jgi:hypothetical protein
MGFEHLLGEGLVDLVVEGVRGFEKVEQLAVVHLEKYASDLAGKFGLCGVDERVETLADHVLLLLRVGSGKKGGGGEGLLQIEVFIRYTNLHRLLFSIQHRCSAQCAL